MSILYCIYQNTVEVPVVTVGGVVVTAPAVVPAGVVKGFDVTVDSVLFKLIFNFVNTRIRQKYLLLLLEV